MQTLWFSCLFFPKQRPQVVPWALDAEVRQRAQINELHCTRAAPGEVAEEAKAKIQIPEFWEQAESMDTGLLEDLGVVPMGGLVTKQWRATLLEHLGLTRSYNLPKTSGYQACAVGSHAHSPCLCNDFWSHVGGCPTDSVQRAFHHRRQSKVSKLQRLGSIWIFTHLGSEKSTQNEEENICIFISSNFFGKSSSPNQGDRKNRSCRERREKIIFPLTAAEASVQWSCLPAM